MGLANALSTSAEITVIHPEAIHGTCRILAAPGVTLVPFPKPLRRRNPRNFWAMGHAFRLIEQTKPDVLHVQETFDYAYDLYSLFVRFPVLVTTIHDVVPHPGDGHAAPGLQYTKAIGCWRSSRLIVHTEAMRVQLSERFRIALERIDVIPHGELGSLYRRLASEAGIKEVAREPYTMLFFGRIWPYKGLRYLLEAFVRVKGEIPEARLLICGRGGDLDANAALIASMEGIEVRKTFIAEQDVAGLFERSSIVVLPYIEASQSGVSAIGLTLGSVVVASDVGGFAEQIHNGMTGILVPPRNSPDLAVALIGLLKDAATQERIRQNAASFGRSTLDWANIAESTLYTYRIAYAAKHSLRKE